MPHLPERAFGPTMHHLTKQASTKGSLAVLDDHLALTLREMGAKEATQALVSICQVIILPPSSTTTPTYTNSHHAHAHTPMLARSHKRARARLSIFAGPLGQAARQGAHRADADDGATRGGRPHRGAPRAAPRRATPRRAAPRHATPRHAMLQHELENIFASGDVPDSIFEL